MSTDGPARQKRDATRTFSASAARPQNANDELDAGVPAATLTYGERGLGPWDVSSNVSSRTGPKLSGGRLRRQDSLTDPYQKSIGQPSVISPSGGIPHYRSPPPLPLPSKAPGAWPSTTESQSTIAPFVSRDACRGDHWDQRLSPEDDKPFRQKREVHRRRKDLKASGDFLGVQGINPDTGQLDVLTPTTGSKSTISSGASGVPASVAQSSIEKYEKEKDELRRQQSLVRWRKDTGQWSSVAEPTLSPIAQSRSSTPCRFIVP
ncbi:hypothetical protein HMPREF1624_04127 [Sporothrix schenckii ATCC 58251]|uniref:Uncharacterized protein n=1 Tax=Sporothrix schenckii (strain ATCC 58251 / de Perez 2211183) TaxID=1391915 RepID=U7PW41_SPOS1|nr:hypothetical protein HMPREF1624_04127 [Sporothrix schenckii ATCC 58251]